jgi:predicted aspartyl protease
MNPRFLPLACLGLVFLSITHANAQAAFADTTSVSEIPFRLSSGYLIEVQGRIGDQDKLKFVLDTGASITIVDQKIADKLKLERRPAESFSFDRKIQWQSATVPEIQFGPVRASNVVAFVGHLAGYSEFAKNADAIIGMDLLRLCDFTIDFDAKRIAFQAAAQKAYVAPGDPMTECLFLDIQLQGRSVRLILDTGFPGLLLYENRVRSRVPGLRTKGSAVNVLMGGRMQAKQAVLPDILFGKADRDVPALLVPAAAAGMLPGVDGVIGLPVLQAHRIRFDFVGRILQWE